MRLTSADELEVHTLRRALSDIAALSSLPAMWTKADERQIAESVAESVLHVLGLDGVRITLSLGPAAPIEIERTSETRGWDLPAGLRNPLGEDGAHSDAEVSLVGDGWRGVSVGIGLAGAGRLRAISARAGFPTEAERLALVMTANQMAVALERVRAERGLLAQTQALNTERDRLRQLFEQAPGFMAILRGPQHVFELCNQSYYRLIGQRHVVGLTVREAFPELEGQGFFELLDETYAAGKPHVTASAPIDLRRAVGGGLERRYLDFIYQPIRDHLGRVTGIFAEGYDVTEQVEARAQLKLGEESLRLATAAADVGIWDLDLRTDVLTWCERTKAMFGISADVPCSMADFDAGLHPDDRAATRAAFASALDPQKRTTYDVEYRTIGREDGVIRWVAAKGKGVFDRDRCIRAIGTAIDITERKAVEQRLLKSESDLRDLNLTLEARVEEQSRERDRIWRNSRDLHVVVGADGVFRAVNPAWKTILGHDPEEVVGRSFMDFVCPGDGDLKQSGLDMAASREDLTSFETRYQHKDGTPRWISWHTSVQGDLVYAYGRDVSAEKQQIAALKEAEERIRQSQKMEAIGQLTGGVAHDFNNLLTVIRSSADLLRRENLAEEKRRRYINAICETADRGAKLTGQLLAFARRQALRPEVFDVAERLQQVGEMLRTVLGSRIVLDLASIEKGAVVEADISQFETALVNLAANARDAMDGEGRLTIRLERSSASLDANDSADGRGRVAISISDTGCGIAADKLAHIFEPFFTTKEVGRGTGLGLSQVYGFAKQSGGEVSVESELGRGTTFVLSLPLSTKPVISTDSLTAGTQTPRQSGCVLVVEDNVEVGEFSSQLLNDLGFHTVLAANGEEALKILGESPGRFNVVFSDVVMPGMGGVALAKEIRQRFPQLPVVLTSGYSHVLAEGGPQGFELVQKPYSAESLSRVLRRALVRRAPGVPRRDSAPVPGHDLGYPLGS